MADAPKSFTTQFSRIGVFLLLVFSIALVVVSVINALHYDSILDKSNGDDTQIGVGRGSLIWFYWLNVLLAIFGSFATIYFFYRLFFKGKFTESKVVTYLSGKLGAENKGIDKYLLENNCKELNIKGEDCQEYGTLNDSEKVDFYLEKIGGIDSEKFVKIKEKLCSKKLGSSCNKYLKNNYTKEELIGVANS
jgi:hypothetical protein